MRARCVPGAFRNNLFRRGIFMAYVSGFEKGYTVPYSQYLTLVFIREEDIFIKGNRYESI